jgi:hypothetical protein
MCHLYSNRGIRYFVLGIFLALFFHSTAFSQDTLYVIYHDHMVAHPDFSGAPGTDDPQQVCRANDGGDYCPGCEPWNGPQGMVEYYLNPQTRRKRGKPLLLPRF